MVTDFWAWKHVAQARGLVWLRQDYVAGLIQGSVCRGSKSDCNVGGVLRRGKILAME